MPGGRGYLNAYAGAAVIRFLLDEMFSQIIAAMIRQEAIELVSLHERQAEGTSDHDILLQAGRERRCVITQNHRHFVRLTAQFSEQGLPHAGVLLIAGSVPTNAYAAIARAIVRFAEENPDGLQPYEVRWLHVDLR